MHTFGKISALSPVVPPSDATPVPNGRYRKIIMLWKLCLAFILVGFLFKKISIGITLIIWISLFISISFAFKIIIYTDPKISAKSRTQTPPSSYQNWNFFGFSFSKLIHFENDSYSSVDIHKFQNLLKFPSSHCFIFKTFPTLAMIQIFTKVVLNMPTLAHSHWIAPIFDVLRQNTEEIAFSLKFSQ